MPTWKLVTQAIRNGCSFADGVSTVFDGGQSRCDRTQNSAAVKGRERARLAQELAWAVTQPALNDGVEGGLTQDR
jgi:hypothetical protein